MSSDPGNGTTAYRLATIERRVDRLEEGQPAVLAERVVSLTREVHELREELKSLRRLVMGAFATIATGLTVAIVVQNSGAL